jgi:hypothetical protein
MGQATDEIRRRRRDDIAVQLTTAERQLSHLVGETLSEYGSQHPITRSVQNAYNITRDASMFNEVERKNAGH